MKKAQPEAKVVQVKPRIGAAKTKRIGTAETNKITEHSADIDKNDKSPVTPNTHLIGMDQADFKNSASEAAPTSDERVRIHYQATVDAFSKRLKLFSHTFSATRMSMAKVCYILQRPVLMAVMRWFN